jgi:homoserine trans-succinylase
VTCFGSSASQDHDEEDKGVSMEIDGKGNDANVDMEEDNNDLEEALDVDVEDEYIPDDDDDNNDRAEWFAQHQQKHYCSIGEDYFPIAAYSCYSQP